MRLDEDEGECFLLSLMPVWADVFLAITCDSVCAATTGCIVCTNSQRKRDLTPCSPVWFGYIWQGRRVSIKVLRVSRAYGHDRTLKLKLASVISVTAGRRILFIPPLTFRGKRATVSQILQLQREQSHKLSHLTTTKEPTNEPVAKIWRQISTYHQK